MTAVTNNSAQPVQKEPYVISTNSLMAIKALTHSAAFGLATYYNPIATLVGALTRAALLPPPDNIKLSEETDRNSAVSYAALAALASVYMCSVQGPHTVIPSFFGAKMMTALLHCIQAKASN